MAGDLPFFDPFKALAEIRREKAMSTRPELSQKLSQPPAKANTEREQEVNPTFATFATFAEGSVARDLAPARVKEEERKNNSINSYTYARTGHAQQHVSENGHEGPAKVAKAANFELSACDTKKTSETGVAKVLEDGLRKWRACLSALSPDSPPCPGYRLDEWPRTLSRALAFLDTFGPQAEALGWTAPRLFGVHREAGIVRTDACGALVLPICGEPRAITATEVSFGHLTYRVKPGQPVGVPWWEWGR